MNKQITNKKTNVQTELEDLNNKWKRALADYQNLERRVEISKDEFVRFANTNLILKILPALDTLERADKHLKDEGLRLAIKQLAASLEEEGLKKIETVNKDFDPVIMECIDVAEGEDGKVIEELRPGYTLNDKVIRPAQVRVGKAAGQAVPA